MCVCIYSMVYLADDDVSTHTFSVCIDGMFPDKQRDCQRRER